MTTRDSDTNASETQGNADRAARPATRTPSDVAVERTPVVEAGPKAVRTMTLPGTAGAPRIVGRDAEGSSGASGPARPDAG